MAAADNVRIVLHEEGQKQQADVHAVIIRIGCDYNVVVAEILNVLFHTQGGNKKVEFLVFCYFLTSVLERVEGLSAKGEHRLVEGVADDGVRLHPSGTPYADHDGYELVIQPFPQG